MGGSATDPVGGSAADPVGRVVVVGLGPAGPDLLTAATTAAIAAVPRRFLRTARPPSAAAVGEARSFDDRYEREASFDAVYASIVDTLVAEASAHGEVLYAVPGSPVVAERTVELLGLRSFARVDMLLDERDGVPKVLEADAVPGLTDTSLLPQSIEAAGIGFDEFVGQAVEEALAAA